MDVRVETMEYFEQVDCEVLDDACGMFYCRGGKEILINQYDHVLVIRPRIPSGRIPVNQAPPQSFQGPSLVPTQ